MRIPPLRPINAVVVCVCVLLTGCSSSSSTTAASTQPPSHTLTVFLAGSLSNSFLQLSHQFEADNPGVTVNLSSTLSADLANQIVAGTQADVFAPAGDEAMRTVTDAMKTDGSPVVFATNLLEIATALANPKHIVSFADLARSGVTVSVCDPVAACGMATLQVEQTTGVKLAPISRQSSLDSVLSDVTTGRADAGLIYVTDILAAANTVLGVMFPESSAAVTDYPISVIKGARDPELARRFVEFVTGTSGLRALRAAGFGPK